MKKYAVKTFNSISFQTYFINASSKDDAADRIRLFTNNNIISIKTHRRRA